jgi:hypothetical protein
VWPELRYADFTSAGKANFMPRRVLRTLTAWKVHTPTGDRKGTWSLGLTGVMKKAEKPSQAILRL